MLLNIVNFIFISVVMYFAIALLCIILGKWIKQAVPKSTLSFDELAFDGLASDEPAFEQLSFDKSATTKAEPPKLKTYQARDGERLPYRHYRAQSDKIIILLHGSGWHSQYLFPLANFISGEGIAQVYTPDLRGHGQAPRRRGDVDYIGQFEDDLADLIEVIKRDNPDCTLIVAGHSSGGGLAIRFGGSRYGKQADGYILLSPYLKYNAPSMRPNSGGWALPYTLRIAGLSMLNNVGIHGLDYLTAIDFNMPQEVRNGTETLSYTHRLNTAYAPGNYKKELSSITQPLLVVVGTADEAFFAEQFEPEISKYTRAEVILLNDVTHMGVVVNPAVRPVIKQWLDNLR
ncbi:alpha/beta hydrolase [Shewanella sp. 0m-8]